jgi:cyclophilin family peptidyl-prolyl cis-trans isomerase
MSESTTQEVAILHTNLGDIVVGFHPHKAPKHVENFKKLVREGFYNGTKFHRVIPGFMIQGGDPNSKSPDRARHGTGGPGYSVNAEFNDTKHVRGILSAARSQDPNSAGSQFFLMVATSPHLDGQYTAYGEVLEGMEVVDKIVNLKKDHRDNPLPENPATIESAEIVERAA